MGTVNEGLGSRYAPVVSDFATGRSYAVPFDRTALRFETIWDATPEWLARNFEWTHDAAGADLLRVRPNLKPPPWQGRFGNEGCEMNLYPTRPEMFDAFTGWLKKEYTPVPVSERDEKLPSMIGSEWTVRGLTLNITYFREKSTTALYFASPKTGSREPYCALVQEIGARFNAELASGRFQQLFTAYP